MVCFWIYYKRKKHPTNSKWSILIKNRKQNISLQLNHFVHSNSEEEGKKGHHDKEEEEGDFAEKKGHKKKHYDESG